MLNNIFLRGKRYYYRRRVPSYVAHLDTRSEIWLSLKTKDYSEAVSKAKIYGEHLEDYWAKLLKSGHSKSAMEKYRDVVRLAEVHGFTYKTSMEVENLPLPELLQRFQQPLLIPKQAEAFLGGLDEPQTMLSDCDKQYWDLTADRLLDKTEHKARKWKTPRKAALDNFIEVVGDKPIKDITRSDILEFKAWWRERLQLGRSPATANKQLQQIKDIIQTVALENEVQLEVEPLFANVRFRNTVKSRPPFEASYVQDTLLKKLADLNERDRLVVWVLADTGARETEIFGLVEDDIKLKAPIPYIWIRPREGHSLKTATSERKIPLVGTALYAFQQYPQGFELLGNPDTFSNIVNKYLTTKELRPTPRHSLYSLRHTFKDRLRDIGAPEEVIDQLMGHRKKGPQYGRGHTLETLHRWLSKIAYRVPGQ